ncbi:MAG: winged helix-turn-helix domain-containing tetratricopeptide repeat protein [Cellvibrionaceae bacterium]
MDVNKGFVLGDWQVDPLAGRVSRGDQSVHVEPKVMEVLVCLAKYAGETVSREQLLNEVWDGVVVSEEVLTRAISELRSLLGDTAREKRYVKTLPKRGYSLIASVESVAHQVAEVASAPKSSAPIISDPFEGRSRAESRQDAEASLSESSDDKSPERQPPWPVVIIQQILHFLYSLIRTAGKLVLLMVLLGASLIIFSIVNDNDDTSVIITSEDVKTQDLIDHVIQRIENKLDEPEGGITLSSSRPTSNSTATENAELRTIAVLPFVDLSAQGDQAYFADGVSEDIRNALIGSKDLRVVARTSSRVFKDQVLDVREIGKQLSAQVLVEGTVRIQGQQVRVTVQLTDTRSGFPIWAGSFDRSMVNAFAIQREIAQEVASKLELTMSATQMSYVNSRAYEKYLLGRHYWHQRTPESLAAARKEFSEAITIQPDYALAYSGLADGYTLGVIYEDLDEKESLALAQANVDKALELDSRLAEAYASQGLILEVRQDVKPSRRAYERAVQLKPDYSMARMWLGNILMIEGELGQAYEQYRSALDNDPLHPSIQSNYLSALQMQGRFDEALSLGEKFYNQSRSGALLKQSLNALVNAGRYDEVLDYILSHNFPSKNKKHIEHDIIDALLRLGQIEQAQSLLAQRRPDLKEWQLAILDMEMALVTQQYSAIDAIAERVEAIDPGAMWADKAKCENYDKANVARADYWRGLKAYAEQNYEQAEELFEVANANGGGCWKEPDIELSLMLYRADVAGLLNKDEKRRALLHNIEQRIAKMRGQGWGHLPLQVSELVYFILTNQSTELAANLARMNEKNIQPMGIAAVDPLLNRHLKFADTAALFDQTNRLFSEMKKRASQKQLAKFGL